MKCEECLPLIEEYVDGELRESVSQPLAAHLATCAMCASEVEELQREQELYAGYRREIEVTPAHWNMLRARIEQEKASPVKEPGNRLREWFGGFFGSGTRFRPALVLALLLIFIGVTAAIIYNSRHRGSEIVTHPQKQETIQSQDAPQKNQTPGKVNDDKQLVARDETGQDSREQTGAAGTPRRLKEKRTTVAVNKTSPAPQQKEPRQMLPANEPRFEEAMADERGVMTNARWSMPAPAGDFDFEIARHAEKAELLLRSFRNVRPPTLINALDVSYEKEESRKLLYQNISLRRDAETRGDQSAAALLNTLEPILLDIAHLPARARTRDVRPIEQRMRKKEIVAALQVRALVASN